MAKLSKSSSSDRPKFKYRPPNPDAVKRRAENKGGMSDSIFKNGFDVYRPKQGDNAIRFLPPTWDDPEDYAYEIWVHTWIGADKGSYLCPRKMENSTCPICDMSRECADAGEEDDAKKLKVKQAFATWIIDRKGEEDHPMLYQVSWTQDRDISQIRKQKKGGILDVANPDVGFDISFNRSGAGLNTDYSGWAVDREESPISGDSDIQDKILNYIQDNPIPNILLMHDADYLERVIQAKVPERNEDDNNESEQEETDDRQSRRRREEHEKSEDEEAGSEKTESRGRHSIPRERLKPRPEPESKTKTNDEENGEDVEEDMPWKNDDKDSEENGENDENGEEDEPEEDNRRISRKEKEDRARNQGRSEEKERYSKPPRSQRR